MKNHLLKNIWLTALVLIFAQGFAHAQPTLNFKRVVIRWPSIDLYFTVACNGTPFYAFDKQNIEITENGERISDFTLWCPDPQARCAISVALVFDASSSMQGPGNAGAIAAGNAFIDLMDGVVDEACIVWFESSVNVRLGMTTNLTDLHDAVNSLPASGGTACWDGMYVGVSELINSGNNLCRAVIAVTDGSDNSSVHTPQDVISLANRNMIRVYTVGLGGVEPTNLELIALLTGGKYFQAPSPDQLVAIYQEIATIVFAGHFECYLTYQASCPDGGLRTVDFKFKDVCSGTDTKTKTYRALKDTSMFTSEYFSIDSTIAKPGADVLLPVWVTPPGAGRYEKFTATFGYDPALCTFLDVVRTGTMLESTLVDITPMAQTVELKTNDRVAVNSMLPLCYLKFHVKETTPPVSVAPVDFTSMVFEAGCLRPVLRDGFIRVWDSLRPYIVADGPMVMCEGGSVRLQCTDGFTDYLWSTGATNKSIFVTTAGKYWVQVRNHTGALAMSDTVEVVIHPIIKPVIVPGTPLVRCEGMSVFLAMTGSFVSQKWSTGETGKYITVTRPGKYYVTGTNPNGCVGTSDTVTVDFRTLPPSYIFGRSSICDTKKEYTYYVDSLPNARYTWHATRGMVFSSNAHSAVIRWTGTGEGQVSVTVTDTATGCVRTDSLEVTITNTIKQLDITKDTTLCAGDTLTLDTLVPHDAYLWSTGETTQQIRITIPGIYFCQMMDNSCMVMSDTINVNMFDMASATLSGPRRICAGASGTYLVDYQGPAQYTWTVTGGTIVSGGNVSSAVIQWNNVDTGKIVIEMTAGSCNGTIATAVQIDENIAPALNIAADTVLCEGDSLMLEAQSGYTTYAWSNGASGRTIIVSSTGYYFVEATNAGGCVSRSDTIHVLFSQKPQQPSIVQSNDLLICTTPAQRYQWYVNGQMIPGATNDTLVYASVGAYTVQVWNEYGCSNGSEPLTPVGVEKPGLPGSFTVDIVPNPGNGVFNVMLEFQSPRTCTIEVTNSAGMKMASYSIQEPATSVRKQISLGSAAPGIYLMKVQAGTDIQWKKVIVQHR